MHLNAGHEAKYQMKPTEDPIRPLRILHVEDSKLDAELTCALLRRSGLKFECVQIDTEAEFTAAMNTGLWDVILADYNLPTFTGLAALEIACRLKPDIPFIIVSGVLGEEVAIDTLKNGATDYVLKERMDRLAPAIQRALAECNERRQRREAQAALLESESRLRAALAEAEQANAAKDQFLATLSHELRTPLAPILTTVQILSFDSSLTSEQQEHVAVIRRNAELEARLIDDLLDLTRIVRGKVQLQEQPVELHQLIDGVVEICRDDFVAKHHVLEKRFDATASIVKGDIARLQQILWNLLKNAIKFTPNGGCIRITTRNTSDSQVEIGVVDNGIGIEASVLPRIFAPFEQANSQITHRFGGLGLGLSIAKLLAQKHGGTLVAQSGGRDQGSVFTLHAALRERRDSCAAAAGTSPDQGCFAAHSAGRRPRGHGQGHVAIAADAGTSREIGDQYQRGTRGRPRNGSRSADQRHRLARWQWAGRGQAVESRAPK